MSGILGSSLMSVSNGTPMPPSWPLGLVPLSIASHSWVTLFGASNSTTGAMSSIPSYSQSSSMASPSGHIDPQSASSRPFRWHRTTLFVISVAPFTLPQSSRCTTYLRSLPYTSRSQSTAPPSLPAFPAFPLLLTFAPLCLWTRRHSLPLTLQSPLCSLHSSLPPSPSFTSPLDSLGRIPESTMH